MKLVIEREDGSLVMKPATTEPMTFHSKDEAKAWISVHMKIVGLDWQVGWHFKGIGDQPMKIVTAKGRKMLVYP